MADKAISELVEAPSVTPDSLFVLQQDNTAKKLTAQALENWLVSFAEGHGGIQSYGLLKTVGLVKTYRFTLADQSYMDIDVVDGRGVESVKPTSTNGLEVTYTITYNDGTTNTFTVTNGAKGDKGDRADIWVKYASQKPTASSHSFGDIPDAWIGISSGHVAEAPTDWQQYTWYQWKGEKGDTGEPAIRQSVTREYQVGDYGNIIPSGAWLSSIPNVPQGKYLWIRKTTVWNKGDPDVDYSVSRMGLDGSGAVSSVAGISPNSDGNVPLTAEDVKALPIGGGAMAGPINMNGKTLYGLNAPTTDNEAATKGYVDEVKTDVNNAVKEAAPYNYAHNSDFTQFIAQAGIGGNHGNQAYAGDRWILDSGTVTGDEREDGNGYTNITLNGTIRQVVSNPPAMGIATIEMVSGTAAISYADGEVTISSSGGVIKNAALYEKEYTTETLPEYRPKGYGAELVECYRYFVDLGRCNIGAKDKWGFYFVDVRFPVEMRIAPSIMFKNPATGTVNAIGQWNGSTFSDFSDVVVGTITRKVFGLGSGGGTLTAGTSYTFDATASADL